MTPSRMSCFATCLLLAAGAVTADQISIGFEAAEGYTAPASIDNQPAVGGRWLVNKPDYDQEVTNAVGAAHSGTQAFRWSNRYFDTVVRAIVSPSLVVPAGETGSFANAGVTPAPPGSNRFAQDFWFRSVGTAADLGLNLTISGDDGGDLRMTFLRIRENGGVLQVSYVGYDVGTNTFPETVVATGLAWGTWYHVHIDADLIDGPSNDVVRVYLGTAPVLGPADLLLTASTWEDLYGVGQRVAMNSVLFRISNNPGAGNVPLGLYMDELVFSSGPILALAGGAGGLNRVPTLGQFAIVLLALLIVASAFGLRRRK